MTYGDAKVTPGHNGGEIARSKISPQTQSG
jgi:hypothetical protein